MCCLRDKRSEGDENINDHRGGDIEGGHCG